MSKVACGSHHSLALTLEGEVSEINRGHYVAKGVHTGVSAFASQHQFARQEGVNGCLLEVITH